jgi:hypothetical protein
VCLIWFCKFCMMCEHKGEMCAKYSFFGRVAGNIYNVLGSLQTITMFNFS